MDVSKSNIMKKRVYFVYDFILPSGPLQFGYNRYTLPINVMNQIDNHVDTPGVLLASPHNPGKFDFQEGMFADEYINQNDEWIKTTVSEVDGIMKSSRYDKNNTLFFIVLESTNASSFFEYYTDVSNKFEDMFSPKLLDYYKKYENFKIAMIDNREGSYPHKPALFKKINNFLDNLGITSNQKFVISTCNEHINKFKSYKQNTRIAIYNNDYYVYKSGQFIVETEERENSIVENGYNYSLQQNLIFDKKEKYYLMYNRNSARLHRPYFVNKLFKNNLLDKGIISLFKTPDFDFQLKSKNNDGNLNISKSDWNEWSEYIDKWYPLIIDNGYEEEVAWYHNFLSRKDEYEKTYFSIVSETNAESKYLFITEKTLKPIMNLHPFFINGNPGTLKHLQSIGFKTFDKWWDESYDSELDFKKRVEMTLKEIKSICSKTPTEMIEMIKEMKPTLEYNKNLLKELFVNGEFENKLLTQLYKKTNLI